MTTTRTPVRWIVPIPEDDAFGRTSFTCACRGNKDIAEVLNYFLYEASREAERRHIDAKKVEYITVERSHDDILPRVRVSEKTLIAYIKKLEEWKLIDAFGYKRRYHVYFKRVADAIKNPPEPIKPRPRGKHAPNCKSTTRTISEDLPDGKDGQIVFLQSEIVDLQSQMANLQSIIVNLQSEMVKLQSVQPSQHPSEQGSNGTFAAPKNLENLQESNKNKEKGTGDFASAQSPFFEHASEENFEEDDEPGVNPSTSQQTPFPARSAPPCERKDGAATPPVDGSGPRPSSDEPQETPAQERARLKRRQEDILALHCQLLKRNVVQSADELEGARLLAKAGATDAEITLTHNTYKKHSFWGPQLHLRNIAKLLDTTVTAQQQPAAATSPPRYEDDPFAAAMAAALERNRQLEREGGATWQD